MIKYMKLNKSLNNKNFSDKNLMNNVESIEKKVSQKKLMMIPREPIPREQAF